MLGGDSSLGHLLYVRGDPHDYDHWAKLVKDESWNYKNLLHYFKKSENLEDKHVLNSHHASYHGTDGLMGITKHHKEISKKYLHAFKEAGNHIILDGNGEKTLGYYEPMYMVKDGIRQSMPYTFLNPIKHRPNLHLLKETEATLINFVGNTAVSVTAVKNGRTIRIKAKREIIVSAGTMKTAQLLMLSGIGPKDELDSYRIRTKANLPVGKYYQDHLGVILVHKLNIQDPKRAPADPHDVPSATIIGNVALDPSVNHPQYQSLNTIIPSDSDALLTMCSISYSYKNEICQSLYNQTKGYETIVSKIVLLHPKSAGRVVLQSRNYKDRPLIISGLFSHEEDLDSIASYINHFLGIAKTNTFTRYGAELVYPKMNECSGHLGAYWKCYALAMVGTTYRYTGTCSMGKVVDGRLKVHGINSLRVVDASVIPAYTSGSTQAAVMAIAEKAADMILEDANNNLKQC